MVIQITGDLIIAGWFVKIVMRYNLLIADEIKVRTKITQCEMNTESKDTKKENVLKILVSDGKIAKFVRAIAGVLYYKVEVDGGAYEFPVDMNDKEDVGTATFDAEIKAITLMRYIRKAESAGTLIHIHS